MLGGHAWIVLVVIALLVLIVMGPGKLSQLGGALGKSLKEFRKSQADTEPPAGAPDKEERR